MDLKEASEILVIKTIIIAIAESSGCIFRHWPPDWRVRYVPFVKRTRKDSTVRWLPCFRKGEVFG